MVWYSHLLKNLPQFIVIHIDKGFGIVNEAKINKRDLIKLSSFGTAEEATNKAKRQSTNWDKILANYETE